ncbi:MAG: fimbrillin family protein [Prevotellaceae bacterium]|nr:fimbrillin family protein [Prevotellaceae bacterium]
MKKNLFFMLGLGAMLLTSCDQDITNEIYLPGSGGSVTVADSTRTSYLSINTSIAPSGSLTRAVNDAWENGDAVGVYADYASGSSWFTNAKFVRKDNSSQFVSEIPYYYQD